jgi:hypothetical protein
MGLFDFLKMKDVEIPNEELTMVKALFERCFKELLLTEYSIERESNGDMTMELKFENVPHAPVPPEE